MVCAESGRVVLASVVARIKGVMFYNYATSGACHGDRVCILRRPDNQYNSNCFDIRLSRGSYLLGHLEAPMAARLSPVIRDVSVVVLG